jgi:transketolase
VIDIATAIYDGLRPDDVVIWSKGWAAAAEYYFLAQQGKIPMEDLEKFGKEIDGKIEYLGLAETSVNGVLCNGGSVGHGLPIAVGHAYAKKLKGEAGTVYCIMSDGELNEGTIWESAMLAKQLSLDNLIAVVDKNNWQAMGRTSEVMDIDARNIFEAFGWESDSCDGHDFTRITFRLATAFVALIPQVIICHTIKGKGVSFFEDHLLYHYKHVTEEEYERALKEL